MSEPEHLASPADQSGNLDIKYVYPADHHSAFANHFVVHQNAFGECRLSFFELRDPVILGSVEERRQKLMEIGHIDAVCVAEVVITKQRMAQVLAAILENLSKTPTKTPDKPAEASDEQTCPTVSSC